MKFRPPSVDRKERPERCLSIHSLDPQSVLVLKEETWVEHREEEGEQNERSLKEIRESSPSERLQTTLGFNGVDWWSVNHVSLRGTKGSDDQIGRFDERTDTRQSVVLSIEMDDSPRNNWKKYPRIESLLSDQPPHRDGEPVWSKMLDW